MRLETERFFRRLQQKRPLVYEDEGSGQGFVCGPEKKELVEMGLTGRVIYGTHKIKKSQILYC